ncbi:putative protein isoform X1 [Capsicum annuum]|uniref:uncharacterized protein LOC107843201 isoform X1 n=1 Tax=Capsicum annuum TaxID=4072 RepID=UPI0007BEDCD8|nr:uncharacterized protein LOC107843201 isoform X1 [Capsicum annuum]
MKRKHKGDNIPSQSLAQQDESVQQKNPHEAAEKIPTETSSKKMKTYSRKMPPPSKTSTLPSTSSFPTSSTRANEDRTKADKQMAVTWQKTKEQAQDTAQIQVASPQSEEEEGSTSSTRSSESSFPSSSESSFPTSSSEATSEERQQLAGSDPANGSSAKATSEKGQQLDEQRELTNVRWLVPGMRSIYQRDMALNEKGHPKRSIFEEPRIRTEDLAAVPEVKATFDRYQLGWMGEAPGRYSPEMVREFFASYAASLSSSTPKGQLVKNQPPMDRVQVRGRLVDISERTIQRLLFGTEFKAPTSTAEYNHRVSIVKDRVKMADPVQRSSLLKWVASFIAENREEASWVTSKGTITKASLNFAAKFWWAIVRSRLGSTSGDNRLTPDRAVLVASIMAGYNINIPRYIVEEIRERALQVTTSIPFPCLVYRLCRESGVPVLPEIDHPVEVTRIQDIGLIRDGTNPVAKFRGHPSTSSGSAFMEGLLGGKQVDTSILTEQVGMANFEPQTQTTNADADVTAAITSTPSTTPTSASIPTASPAPSVPRPAATAMVTISEDYLQKVARRQLQTEMTHLMQQQLKPWVKLEIAASESRLRAEKDQSVRELHERMDGFEQRIHDRLQIRQAPNLGKLQDELTQMRADVTPISTSEKKMKTYSRKMSSPGTTSSLPSTPSFPTSSTPANEDRTKAENRVVVDDTPISTAENAGEKCTVSPSLADTGNKASDVCEPPDSPVKFANVEDFFAQVSVQIKQAQSLGFSADHSSLIDKKISAMQKFMPSAEMLATAKGDIERLLTMPSIDLLLPENCSALSAALSIYAVAPDLSVERALSVEKLKENLPHFSLTLRRAKKDQEEYYKKAAKKVVLVDELIRDQELYTNLKDGNEKLEYQISKLEATLKVVKKKRDAIQEQKLSLAKKCSGKSNALDEMESEFPLLKEMKELADSDVARVEESLRDFKSKIIK